MSFLPIVQRELREAARRRSSFRIRTLVAIMTSAGAAAILLFSFGVPPGQLGRGVFATLGLLALGYCLLEGARNAADCISEEKRDGTLGLLFLTDLRGFDIVLGKLVTVSARAFQGLFAFMPVLAIALILGGVTGGEFWRLTAVLLNTLFFSTCMGLTISCFSREAHKALTGTLLALGLVTIVPFVLMNMPVWSLAPLRWICECVNPLHAGYMSTDVRYRFNPGAFWTSLIGTHLTGWGLLVASSIAIPSVWQDRPFTGARWADRLLELRWLAPLAPGRRKEVRSAMLDQNPLFWLAARNEHERRLIWLILCVTCGTWLVVAFGNRSSLPVITAVSWGVLMLLSLTLRIWMALQGSRHLAEARRNQALELWLVTPLKTDDIIAGQWLAMKHVFVGPVLVVVAGKTFALVLRGFLDGNILAFLPGVPLATYQIVRFVMDLMAIWWVGMWMGLSQKSSTHAFVNTVLIAMVIPELIFCIPNVFIDLGLINWAKTRLNRELRRVASERGGAGEVHSPKRVAVRAAPEAIPPVIAQS